LVRRQLWQLVVRSEGLVMSIKYTTSLSKNEVNSLINRTSKSIELYEGVTLKIVDELKTYKSNEKLMVVVIRK
jgi:hypothetical protein